MKILFFKRTQLDVSFITSVDDVLEILDTLDTETETMGTVEDIQVFLHMEVEDIEKLEVSNFQSNHSLGTFLDDHSMVTYL